LINPGQIEELVLKNMNESVMKVSAIKYQFRSCNPTEMQEKVEKAISNLFSM